MDKRRSLRPLSKLFSSKPKTDMDSFDSEYSNQSQASTQNQTRNYRLFGPERGILSPEQTSELLKSNPKLFFGQNAQEELLSYSPEDKTKLIVEAATLRQLISRLVSPSGSDVISLNDLFVTFSNYTESHQLLKLIQERAEFEPSEEEEMSEAIAKKYEELRPVVLLRAGNALKIWLECNWQTFQDDEKLLKKAIHFVHKAFTGGAQTNLLNLFEKLQKESTVVPIFSEPSPDSLLEKEPITYLSNLQSLELARQLCLYEATILKKIVPSEINHAQWTKPDRDTLAPNVVKLTAWFNKLTYWIAMDILSEQTCETRALKIQYWIQVGDYCLSFNNFNSVQEINCALQMFAVSRLKKSWTLVTQECIEKFEKMKDLMSDAKSYSNYRTRLNELLICGEYPTLPFLGIHLRDILFTSDGNPNIVSVDPERKVSVHEEAPYLEGESSQMDSSDTSTGYTPERKNSVASENSYLRPSIPMINFQKQRLIGSAIRVIQQSQRLSYNFKPISEMFDFFTTFTAVANDNDLWNLSQKFKPEEQDVDKLPDNSDASDFLESLKHNPTTRWIKFNMRALSDSVNTVKKTTKAKFKVTRRLSNPEPPTPSPRPSPTASPKLSKSNPDKLKKTDTIEIMNGLKQNCKAKNRSYFFKTYKNVWLANDAIKWMTENVEDCSELEAIELGNRFRNKGYILCAGDSQKPFQSGYFFFYWIDQPEPNSRGSLG